MKKFIIATACVVSLGLVAIGIQQFQATAGDASISKEEAKQIATEQYPGTVTEVERERENGKEVYEMEITGDEYKYELKLDANTGKIVKLDEKEKVQKQINKRSAFYTKFDQAALFGNDSPYDDGMTYYEIEITADKGEVEVEVNAYTGEIIKISYDD